MKKKNSTPTPKNTISLQLLRQPNVARDATEELKNALMKTAKQLELKRLLEGYRSGKLEVARSLLKMQLLHETILQATGLTEEELDRIGVH
ncbi:hypothetical protein [Candidatus Pantoea persica]|uniref:hypothetical protein n=1 Tax=Candidatus Pantoea persica TaxID=2518128 RepID=UPI00215DBF4D|nr:hypothetical protein [Candidatus Pantoea persica]MBA2815940.1 hypothetical protein [Candidatus Pantoea persica]